LVDLPFPEAGLADAVSRRFRELGHQPLSWTGDVLVDDLSVLADSDLVIHGHPDRGGDLPDRVLRATLGTWRVSQGPAAPGTYSCRRCGCWTATTRAGR